MYENVMENFMKRAWSCKRSSGGHMNINSEHHEFFPLNQRSQSKND